MRGGDGSAVHQERRPLSMLKKRPRREEGAGAAGSGEGGGGEEEGELVKKKWQLCLIRSYEREKPAGYPLTEAQPYLELKFTGSEGSGLHVVPLESIQERVHIIPRAPSEKKRFFLNHFKP